MALAQALAHRRIYYGWYIAGLAFIANFMVTGMGQYAPAVFLKHMTGELGWSRMFFSTAVALGMLLSSPISLMLGPVVDRRGGRWPMVAGGFMLGAGTMAMGLVHTRWEFVLVRGFFIPLGMAGLGMLVTTVAVSNWFVRKRGRALALSLMGLSAGGVVMPPLATSLISALGWRQAWLILGLLAWALILAPAALLMRRRPEDMGLLPDGETSPQAGPGQPPLGREAIWSRREAMRTQALWLLIFAFALGMMGVGSLNAHLYSYLTDIRFSPQMAALVMMTFSIASLSIKPAWGLIAEHVPVRYCAAVTFSLLGVGLSLLVLVGPNHMALFLTVALLGLAWGGTMPLSAIAWANYFGRISLGKVRSIEMPISGAISASGPILAGYLYDVTGSYIRIFTAYIGAQVVAVFLILLARPPRRPGQAASAPARKAL